MVRALIAKRKTVTRREVKGMAASWLNEGFDPKFVADKENGLCPYGQPGDRLWVREAWQPWGYAYADQPEFLIKYPAGGFLMDVLEDPERNDKYAAMINQEICDRSIELDNNGTIAGRDCPLRVRPSIHLWKEFSRIWLEVIGVHIERLQAITKKDALLEGIQPVPNVVDNEPLYESYRAGYPTTTFPVHAFLTLWEKLNGSESLKANPWVWVVEFKILSVTGKGDIGKGRKEMALL